MIEMRARFANRSATSVFFAGPSDGPCRILAVDYGSKRVGLAISDELQCTARPLMILDRKNRRELFRRLRNVCGEYGVLRILVGHPLHLNGDSSPMAEQASRFAARLRKELGLDVELVDERLSSWEAGQTMNEARSSSRRKTSHLDDVAAAVLLRDYLNRKRGSLSEPVPGEA